MLCDPNWARSSTIDSYVDYGEAIGDKTNSVGFTSSFEEKWTPDRSNYPLATLTVSDPVVGIALNGVFIFAGTSEYGSDAFFPVGYKTGTASRLNFDVCLGIQDSYKTYRYHSFSPCIYDITKRAQAKSCADDGSCNANPIKYAVDNVPQVFKGISPIGLARDGRVIYGPYRGDS